MVAEPGAAIGSVTLELPTEAAAASRLRHLAQVFAVANFEAS